MISRTNLARESIELPPRVEAWRGCRFAASDRHVDPIPDLSGDYAPVSGDALRLRLKVGQKCEQVTPGGRVNDDAGPRERTRSNCGRCNCW